MSELLDWVNSEERRMQMKVWISNWSWLMEITDYKEIMEFIYKRKMMNSGVLGLDRIFDKDTKWCLCIGEGSTLWIRMEADLNCLYI